MRVLPLLLLFALPAASQETQVDWVGDWEQAFGQAREQKKPVMICINSKDGERASDQAAKVIYHDPEFVALSRKFVMVVVSTHTHKGSGLCPRFGRITCAQHLLCWKMLAAGHGEQFVLPGGRGEMISPQHAWFQPNGGLLERREYQLAKAELLKRMHAALRAVEVGADGGGEPPLGEAQDAPLNDKDLYELERVRKAEKDGRRAALGNLLATGKTAAAVALVDLLLEARKKEMKAEIVRALGRARAMEAREAIEGCLKDRDAFVRSCASVALESLAHADSVEPLLKKVKSERNTTARKNMYYALGACGGGAGDKNAAKRLLRAVNSDKQMVVRKHAALALMGYEGPGAKLVVKPLEQTAFKTEDREVRGAIVYTLAHIGDATTTLKVFERIKSEASRNPIATAYLREAIKKLQGEGGDLSLSERWLYRENRDDPAR
ncbi:MAG: HEAT repeat domain-containing protein [Planctomycetota bacterium]|jgi:HEAT repeat protein